MSEQEVLCLPIRCWALLFSWVEEKPIRFILPADFSRGERRVGNMEVGREGRGKKLDGTSGRGVILSEVSHHSEYPGCSSVQFLYLFYILCEPEIEPRVLCHRRKLGVYFKIPKVFPAWAVEDRIHFQPSLNGSSRPEQLKPQCRPQLLEKAEPLGSH